MHDDELVVKLQLENGDTLDCIVISIFDVDGNNYIALMPDKTDEILLYRYTESEDDQVTLENIDSNFEFNRALEVFDGLMEDIDGKEGAQDDF